MLMFLHIWILTLSWHVIIVLTLCGDCEVVFVAEVVGLPPSGQKKYIYIYMRSQQKETPQMNNQQWKLNKIQCFYLLRGLMNFLRQQMSYTLIFDLQNCPPIPNLINQGDSPNLLQKSTSTNRIKFPPPRRSDDVNLTQRLSNHKV